MTLRIIRDAVASFKAICSRLSWYQRSVRVQPIDNADQTKMIVFDESEIVLAPRHTFSTGQSQAGAAEHWLMCPRLSSLIQHVARAADYQAV